MQTLHCLSRFLAQFEDRLRAAAGPEHAAAAGGNGGQEPPMTQAGLVATVDLCAKVLSRLAQVARSFLELPPPPRQQQQAADAAAARERRRQEVSRRVFVGELVPALADSCVMEHLARALLLAMEAGASPGGPGPGPGQAHNRSGRDLSGCVQAFSRLGSLADRVDATPAAGGSAAANRLRSTLQGRCAHHLTLAAGLAALCLGDGGSACRLPEGLLGAMPVLGGRPGEPDAPMADVPDALHGGCIVDDRPVRALVMCLAGKTVLQLGPPAPLAALLLVRLGRWAVDSGRAWEETAQKLEPDLELEGRPQPGAQVGAGAQAEETEHEDGGGGVDGAGQAAPPPLQLLVSSDTVAGIVCFALMSLDSLLRRQPPAGGGSAWARRAAAERWRLAVGAIRHVVPWLNEGVLPGLAELFDLLSDGQLLGEEDDAFPLALALSAGLLPSLERMLRRSSRSPDGPEARVAFAVFGPDANGEALLGRLLAHGDPAEAAALVTTIAKLLRGCDWKRAFSLSVCSSTYKLLNELICHVAPTAERANVQLRLMLARAAIEWLPELSRLAIAAARDARTQGRGRGDWQASVLLFALPALAWCLLLPRLVLQRADGARPGPAGARAAGAAAGGGPGGGGEEEEWRRVLLEEARTVQVLAAMLRLAPLCAPGDQSCSDLLCKVTMSCALVAAAAPEALRAELTQDAAALRATRAMAAALGTVDFGCAEQYARRMAALLGEWVRGGEGAKELARVRALVAGDEKAQRAARALPPLAEARALLPACAHPRCTCLDGDSEAGLRLRPFPGCGPGLYCSAACAQAGAQGGAS